MWDISGRVGEEAGQIRRVCLVHELYLVLIDRHARAYAADVTGGLTYK